MNIGERQTWRHVLIYSVIERDRSSPGFAGASIELKKMRPRDVDWRLTGRCDTNETVQQYRRSDQRIRHFGCHKLNSHLHALCFSFCNPHRLLLSDVVHKNRDIREAQLSLGDRATRKHAKDCWNGRGNDNLGWNDLDFKVIKSGTNRKLVYDFLLVVYSNFCRITHRFGEIWCETV